MLGRQDRWQEDLFVAGPLSSLIPDDHILKRVDKVLDLSWLREKVKDLYCHDNGRPGIDPEAAVRLMLAGYFQGVAYRARTKDCRNCRLKERCLNKSASARTIMISKGYEALLRARRRRRKRDKKFTETYMRHRWKIEGMHGEAKTQHGLRRAVRCGLANVAIQAYLTAAVINLKRLVAFAGLFFVKIRVYLRPNRPAQCPDSNGKKFSANREIIYTRKDAA